jgi:hypothetical protein
MAEPAERKVNQTDPAKVKAGDLMAFTYYAKVQSVDNSGRKLGVKSTDTGATFYVDGTPLIQAAASADYYAEEKKVTKTEAAELLISSFGRPFTVVFVTQKDEERTMRGRLISHEALLGRSHVEDLDLDPPTVKRMRLVDHRTIKSLVVDGIKYTVKK